MGKKKITRKYESGIEVEIEGDLLMDMLIDLSECDEVFYDMECVVRNPNGEGFLKTDKVVFEHRISNGVDFIDQVSADFNGHNGAFRWFSRNLGQHQQTKRMYTKKGFKNIDPTKHELGLVGWKKFKGDGQQNGQGGYQGGNGYQNNGGQGGYQGSQGGYNGSQGGYQNNGGQGGQYSPQQPQQSYQKPQQQRPQHNPAPPQESYDDVPF